MKSNTSHPSLSIILLCYKSGAGIIEYVNTLIHALYQGGISDFEIILVCNYIRGEEDKTSAICFSISEKDDKISTIHLPKEGGMGWDLKRGLERAEGDYVCLIDGDGQIPVESVSTLYKQMIIEQADLAKIYRRERQDGTWRVFMSYIYNKFFKLLYPCNFEILDINGKPKIIKKSILNMMHLTSDDWFIDAEIMLEANRLNIKILQIPSYFLENKSRKSLVSVETVIEFIINLLKFRKRYQ